MCGLMNPAGKSGRRKVQREVRGFLGESLAPLAGHFGVCDLAWLLRGRGAGGCGGSKRRGCGQ